VGKIVDALEARGFDLWWDAKIDGGEAFARTIEAKLDSVDAVVVIWSATSSVSDWVRDEAARGRDRRRLVAASLDGTEPPLGFRQYHAVDLSHWHGDADAPEIVSLTRGIIGVAGVDGSAMPAMRPPQVRKQRGWTSRRTVLAAGAGAIALGGAGAIALWHPWRTHTDSSIAVLPFANLSGTTDQAYFSDGLSEEIRAALARNQRLKVAAPTSSNKFRDHSDDARTIAARLGVSFLLEGSVRRAGDVVRVTAELVEAASGFSRWSQTFERRIIDIFAVQSEIAETVARAMDVEMAGDARGKAPGGTSNVTAYEAYLRGRALYDLSSGEASDRAALAQFDAAIAADNDYAAARAARSRTLAAIANQYDHGDGLRASYDKAIDEARHAVQLAPDYADAQSALGYALFNGRLDIRGAERPYEQSRRLGQGNADVLIRYAFYAARTGNAQAARETIDRAILLDPLNPRVYRTLAAVLYAERRFAESIAPGRKALALNPEMGVAHSGIGDALFLLGTVGEALAEYRQEPSGLFRLSGIAIATHRLGDDKAARAALDELTRTFGDGGLYQQALVHAQWGKADKALDLLEHAYRAGDAGLTLARNDPMLDSLRADPRFAKLMTTLGFS